MAARAEVVGGDEGSGALHLAAEVGRVQAALEDRLVHLAQLSERERSGQVKRGIKMFDKLGVKILGLVDNMSYFTGDDGKKYKIFGEGGVKRTAEEFEKEFLGEIPINPEVGKCGDEGKPIVEANPEHEISKIYLDFARKIKSTYL